MDGGLPAVGGERADHPHPRLVGRDEELRRLGSWWESARALDHATVGRIRGEAGVGKSHVVAEFGAGLEARGVQVLKGAATDHAFLPYEPWANALRGRLGRISSDEAATLFRGIEPEAAAIPWLTDLGGLGSEARLGVPDEGAVARAVIGILTNLASTAPTLVVIEDVHWCDRASVALLERVVSEGPKGCALLVVERDPVSFRGPWHEADAARWPTPSWELVLGRLDRPSIAALARASMPGAVTDALVDALYRSTGGNPLIAWSLLAVAARTSLTPEAMAAGLPRTASAIWAQRLEPLSDTTRRVLGFAAAAGTSSDFGWLAQSVGDEASVRRALEDAAGEGLVSLSADGSVQFVHALLREHLYQGLTATRRRRVHRRLAGALEVREGSGPTARSAAVAHHWLESGRTGVTGAFRNTVDAAWWSFRSGSRDGATGEAEAAERLLAEIAGGRGRSPVEVAGWRRELGDLFLRLGHPSGVPLMREAASTFEELDDVGGMARVADGLLRSRASLGVETEGTELASVLVDRLDGVDPNLRSRILARLCRAIEGGEGSEELQADLSVQALRLARSTGDRETLAIALFCHATVTPWTDARLAQIRELVELGRSDGNLEYLLHGLAYLHTLLVDRGDVGAAREVLAELLVVKSRIPAGYAGAIRNGDLAREAEANVAIREAVSAQLDGRLDDQQEVIARLAALSGHHDLERDRLVPVVAVQSGLLAWDRGEVADFVPFTLAFLAEDPTSIYRRVAAVFVLAESGDGDRARTLFDPIMGETFARFPTNQSTSFWLLLLAQVAGDLGDVGAARSIESRLAPYSGRASCFIGGSAGPVDLGLARCAATAGDVDRALALAETASEWCDASSTPLFAARTRVLQGELLAHTGRRREALERFREADELAAARGAGGIVRQVERLRTPS